MSQAALKDLPLSSSAFPRSSTYRSTGHSQLQLLHALRDQHKIWQNPLLQAAQAGQLAFADFQFFFSQYYLYSKNFTRFLAAVMVNCESDYFRSRLSENLWEEGGGADIEQRHAELFRCFLVDHLKIPSLDNIIFEPYTQTFFQQFLHLCLRYKPLEATAVLSLGTESIVPRMYRLLREGLRHIGLEGKALLFFDLHIECDDDHAITLEEMVLSYADQPDWFERCKLAMLTALDLRDEFFTQIYQSLRARNQGLITLIQRASERPKMPLESPPVTDLISSTAFSGNVLYQNEQVDQNIRFQVERIPFNAEVLDPRLVSIPVGFTNERHHHAHETVFLILAGTGEVLVGTRRIPVKAGDLIFVPRWLLHQTRNTGNEELKFLAITDYGFTKRFPENTESVYRLKKEPQSL